MADHPTDGELARECDWPRGTLFAFHDEPGEHDPCYVVMPGGSMLPLNHHNEPGVDIARAWFIINACNAALRTPEQPANTDHTDAALADARFKLWFFREITNDQRQSLICLFLGKEIADEATTHGMQTHALKALLAALRTPAPVNAEQPEGVERFFIDHGMIHDRVTGRHVTTESDDEIWAGMTISDTLQLLNELAAPKHEPTVVGRKAHEVMNALWPLLGDSHPDDDLWLEIFDAITTALSLNPTAEQPAEPQPSVVDAVHQALQRAWDQSDTLPPLTFMHEEGQKLARAAIDATPTNGDG